MGMKLTKEFVNNCRKIGALRDFLCQAMDQVDEKDKIIAELKEQYKDMDVTHTVHIAKMNARIEELEDNVDLWKKENSKLKRALYKACSNWAMAESYSVLNDVPTANRWIHALRKLKEKLEKYK